MQYEIALKGKSYDIDTDWDWFSDSYLPGFRVPGRVESLLLAEWADERGFCKDCGMDSHAHPLGKEGQKYCTILFHDAVKPNWKLKDVV